MTRTAAAGDRAEHRRLRMHLTLAEELQVTLRAMARTGLMP